MPNERGKSRTDHVKPLFTHPEARALERAAAQVVADMHTFRVTFPGRVQQKVVLRALKTLRDAISAPPAPRKFPPPRQV